MWPQEALEPQISTRLWCTLVSQSSSQMWDLEFVLQALQTFQGQVTWLETAALL